MQEELVNLVRSYGVHASPSHLKWPEGSFDDVQDFLIQEIISSSHFLTYAPSDAYQRSFWKWVISNIEGAGEEVQEAIYDQYLDLLSRDSRESDSYAALPPSSFVTYTWEDRLEENGREKGSNAFLFHKFRICTLLEARTIIQSGTTGLRSWTASFVLADYILSRREHFQGARVLELGSGAGFLGIILGQVQSRLANSIDRGKNGLPALFLSDFDDQVLECCRKNTELPCNDLVLHPCLTVTKLDWEDSLRKESQETVAQFLSDADPDFIIGADLIYDVSIIPALVQTLRLSLRNNSDGKSLKPRRALIAATVRNENTLECFLLELKKAGLTFNVVVPDDLPSESHFASTLQTQKSDVVGAEVRIYRIG